MNVKLSNDALNHLRKLPLGNVLKKYIENKEQPHGDFILSLLQNDLIKTVANADAKNQKKIIQYAQFLSFYAPKECYGSFDKIEGWLGRDQDVWRQDIKQILSVQLELNNGDVEGIMQAQFFTLAQEWTKRSSAKDTADRLINLSKLTK